MSRLQPDVLLDVSQAVEHRGVALGQQHGPRARLDPELGRHLGRDDVRRMVVVRRHLHGKLAAGAQRPGEPGEQGGMVGQPVKRRVREHQVERLGGHEVDDVPARDAKP